MIELRWKELRSSESPPLYAIPLEVFQDTGGNLDFESGAMLENTYLEAHKIN